MANEKSERARVDGIERIAAEAILISIRRKSHPLTDEQRDENGTRCYLDASLTFGSRLCKSLKMLDLMRKDGVTLNLRLIKV
jgi:hypothetical protein